MMRGLGILGISFAANAIFWLFLASLGYIQRLLEMGNPRRQPVFFYGAWASWVIVNSPAYYFVEHKALPTNIWVFYILIPTSLVLFFVSWRLIGAFWSVGLRSADPHIHNGIDYRRSLSLVRNELSFLGTGASKLTGLRQEFEAALERCRHDKPVRFLLMKPTDENLTAAATRAGKDKAAYQKQVLESLRQIRRVREERGFNIQVRFYPESPLGRISSVFRLMFIDASLCLVSYNVFGMTTGNREPGSEQPQLHVVRSEADEAARTSFYHPMELFYNALWEKAHEWDFKEFLNG